MIKRFVAHDWFHCNVEGVAKLPTSGRIGVCYGIDYETDSPYSLLQHWWEVSV